MKKSLLKVPATYSQKALHFIQTFEPENIAYNIPFEFRFKGNIDGPALEFALAALVWRHDIFRTYFEWEENQLFQMVRSEATLDHQLIDTQSWTEQEVREQCLAWGGTPFALDKAPLFKSRLLKREQGFTWFLCFHHIAVDHISIRQFAVEVNAAYQRALINQNAVSLKPLPLSLVDYGVWQAQHQGPEQLVEKIQYWQDNIPDSSVVLDLPSDFPRPPILDGQGSEVWFELGKTSQLIRETAKKYQVSRYILTMTQCAILLHRYSNAEHFLIGTPFANRSDQAELQDVFGCFMNTLPLPFDFSDKPSFDTLLSRTHEHFRAMFQRQDVPFELIVEKLQPPRESNHNPLFQVAFMYQAPPMSMTLGESVGENQRLHNGSTKFDLTFWLWDEEDKSIGGTLEYATSLFSKNSVRSMLNVFERIVRASCSSPLIPVHELSLIDEHDKESAALRGVNFTYKTTSVQELIAHTVSHSPDQIAVVSDDGKLTYQELWCASNILAEGLKAQGVKPGALVGIALERSTQMVVGCLGILQAGCTYVPLDPEYPQDRLDYMISHSGMTHIVSQQGVLARFQPGQREGFWPGVLDIHSLLDTSLRKGSAIDDIPLKHGSPLAVDPEQAAYVIYTSGSTGLPKGVAVPHRSVVNFLITMKEKPGFLQTDRLMAVTTLSFDIAVLELFLPLSVGGTVDVVPTAVSKDPHQLGMRIAAFKPTVMQATPATWRMLIQSGWVGQEKPSILVGGEALPEDLVGDLLDRARSVWNMYGPTETTVWSTCVQIHDKETPVTIGKPIGNTQCYIMDEHQNPLPAGVPGELYIGGDGVTLGYLHQPELTQERFVSHPNVKGLLYKTGDLVTRLGSGQLKYHNRLDNQVKIRGFRIELGEIEQVLLKQDAVQSGAVVVQGDGFDKRLVTFYVLHEGAKLTAMKLRRALSSHLPKHMQPESLVVTKALPLTPNGKIDRKKLSARDVEPKEGASTAQPPSTPSEKYYGGLFQAILKREQITVADNFFDIGGHSFASLSIVAAAKRDHGIVIPANALVLNNLAQLALQYPLSLENNAVNTSDADFEKKQSLMPEQAERDKKELTEVETKPAPTNKPWWKKFIDY